MHQKAMPVILTTDEEREAWLSAPWTEAVSLQQPLADRHLRLLLAVHGRTDGTSRDAALEDLFLIFRKKPATNEPLT